MQCPLVLLVAARLVLEICSIFIFKDAGAAVVGRSFEKLIFGGLHEKHAVQRGIWVPTQHLLWDQGKPRKTFNELAGRWTLRMQGTIRNT
jgi:hypothetical protein